MKNGEENNNATILKVTPNFEFSSSRPAVSNPFQSAFSIGIPIEWWAPPQNGYHKMIGARGKANPKMAAIAYCQSHCGCNHTLSFFS